MHVTIDLAGQMRFGPDAFYVDRPTDLWAPPDYAVHERHLDDAHKAITRSVWPCQLSKKLAHCGMPDIFQKWSETPSTQTTLVYGQSLPVLESPSGTSLSRKSLRKVSLVRPFSLFLAMSHFSLVAAGVVNLLGIESPGLTSSPAIAECVAEKLGYQPRYHEDALVLQLNH